MNALFIAAGLFFPTVTFGAEGTPWTDRGYRGEFIRSGSAFARKVGAEQTVEPEDIQRQLTEQPCLFLGTLKNSGIAIGMEAAPVLQAAGPETQMLDAAEGVRHYVYALGSEQFPAHFIISVWRGRVGALQISGFEPLPGMVFNGIALGAPAEQLRARFGEPFAVTDAGLPDTELWSYQPWTFSFEVSLGKVVSIRMDDPAFL